MWWMYSDICSWRISFPTCGAMLAVMLEFLLLHSVKRLEPEDREFVLIRRFALNSHFKTIESLRRV